MEYNVAWLTLLSINIPIMAKETHIDSPQLVSGYIQKLESNVGKLVEAIRKSLLVLIRKLGNISNGMRQAFFYKGEIKPFNPKEYKREIIVMNLFRKEFVLLVFPSGRKLIIHPAYLKVIMQTEEDC